MAEFTIEIVDGSGVLAGHCCLALDSTGNPCPASASFHPAGGRGTDQGAAGLDRRKPGPNRGDSLSPGLGNGAFEHIRRRRPGLPRRRATALQPRRGFRHATQGIPPHLHGGSGDANVGSRGRCLAE